MAKKHEILRKTMFLIFDTNIFETATIILKVTSAPKLILSYYSPQCMNEFPFFEEKIMFRSQDIQIFVFDFFL